MSRQRRRLILPTLAALATALAATTPAHADDMVAELTRDTPIAAYGGALAYSHYEAPTDRYRLMIAAPGGAPQPAPIAASRHAFDVSIGPDGARRLVALYTRCNGAGKRCDIYRYDIARRVERKLGFSSPREDEAWPSQWRDRVAFVRRRPSGGRGEVADCDVPFVKTLGSTRPSRRLDRGSCGRTTGLSLRRERIVQVTFGTPPSATRFDSQVRVLSTRGGAVEVVARQGSGEESNRFSSPSQGPSAVYLTRTGVHPAPAFVVIDLRAKRKTEVRAQTNLTGPLAFDPRAPDAPLFYVEGAGFRGDGCTASTPIPCRLVRTVESPFVFVPRKLLPTLTITAPSNNATPTNPVFGDPFVLSGTLTRKIVDRGRVIATEPLAGVPIELLRRVDDPTQPFLREGFRPTGLTATTGTDGRWSHTLATPPSQPWFSAVTRSANPEMPATYAGRGTVGTVQARMTLTVAGSSFSGTIAPAQPGRTVKIQRLAARKCETAMSGQRFCQDTWTTVADAPVNAAGTGYAATVPVAAPGTYTAALPFEDQQRDPAAYGGRSPETPVG